MRQVAIRALFCNICLCFGQYAVEGCYRTKFKPVTKYTQQLMYISLYISYTWIHIWRCLKRVMVLKFLVYAVNKTRRPLLYIISLCVWPISFSQPPPGSKPRDNIDGPDVTCIECIWCMAAQMACIFPSGYGKRISVWYHLWCLNLDTNSMFEAITVNQSFDDHSFIWVKF